jgi:hypothetical protein
MTPLATDSRSTTEKPTVYRGPAALIGGALVVLFCGFGAIDLLIESGTQDLVAAAILTLVAVLAALYGVYPAAFAWNDRLVVRNPFRTIELPWDAVTDLSARLSFIAHTESRRFTVWAIPVSLRERRRFERHQARELARTQRLNKRYGVSPELAQQRPRNYDPAERLSMAEQAIEEMNARREAYAVQARFKAKEAEQAAAAAAETAASEGAAATAPVADTASTSAASSSEAVSASSAASEAASHPETAPVDSGIVRWSVPSFALVGASAVFLVIALIVH